MQIQIKHRYTGTVLFEADTLSVKLALVKAVESGADLSGADFSGADLSGANFRGANLSGADFSDAHLRGAEGLDGTKGDFWSVLLRAPHEVGGLLLALKEGRVDGSQYEGECACLVGTIANLQHCDYNALPNNLRPNSSRPSERWFMAIRKGDTPQSNPISKLTVEWAEEFQGLLGKAVCGLDGGA